MDPQQQMRFNKVAIRDPEVDNIEGASLLVPEGWTVGGGFHWMPLFSVQANLLLQVSDPGTGASVFTLPGQQFVWTTPPAMLPVGSNYLGSVLLPPPRDAFEFIRTFYLSGTLRHLAGARIVQVEDLSRHAAEASRARGDNRPTRVTRLRHAYEWGGRAWEEDVIITLVYEQPSAVMFWWGLGHAMRAPAGELDRMRPVLSVPIQTLRYSLDWEAMLEHVKNLFRQNMHRTVIRTAEMGRLMRQHREELREMHRQAYEERQASRDRQSFALREALGGIETYKNPFDSHTVELPSHYSYQWMSRSGTVFLTTNPGDDPRVGSNEEWVRMERYRP